MIAWFFLILLGLPYALSAISKLSIEKVLNLLKDLVFILLDLGKGIVFRLSFSSPLSPTFEGEGTYPLATPVSYAYD